MTPPTANWTMKPSANSIGTVSRMLPRHIVASRSRYSMPAGITSSVDVSAKYSFGICAVANMW